MKNASKTTGSDQRWQDWANIVVGAWIFVSPWALASYVAGDAALGAGWSWNFYIVGAVVALLAIAALSVRQSWEEWANVALGAWLLVSPWALGFSAAPALMWNALVAGALVIVFAGWTLSEPGGATPAGA